MPYTCYYHWYSKADLARCAQATNVDWVHTMGDSQEREFVAQLMMINADVRTVMKFDQADMFIGEQGVGGFRATWQFFSASFKAVNPYLVSRNFSNDVQYFDHVHLRPSTVSAPVRTQAFPVRHNCACACAKVVLGSV